MKYTLVEKIDPTENSQKRFTTLCKREIVVRGKQLNSICCNVKLWIIKNSVKIFRGIFKTL